MLFSSNMENVSQGLLLITTSVVLLVEDIYILRNKMRRSRHTEFRMPKLLCTSPISVTISVSLGEVTATLGFLLLQNFSVAISVSPHVCFISVLILISMFLR